MPALHQFVPTLDGGAIGAHVTEIQRTLRAAGWRSEVFAEHTKTPYEGRATPFTEYGRSVPASDADVIVYHVALGSVVADWLFERRPPRLVLDYHNITPPSWFEGWEPNLTYGLGWGRAQLRQLARRTVFGMADSAFNARELDAVGVRRTAVLPILLPEETLGGAPDPATLERLRRTRGARWLFVGRVSPHKAQHRIVAALATYRRLYDPDARLALVGGSSSPHYEAALRRFAAELGIADAVDLVGQISDAQRNAYYAASDVFVCLSSHEGFLVPLLEAWHHRLPIVAFDSTAVPETMGDGGLLLESTASLPVAATVARVVEDQQVADALRMAGTARLEHFSLAHAEARLLELANDLATTDHEPNGLERLAGRTVKVAYVLARYGPEVVGGAEFGARMLAERLAARPGWEVDVYTTCAVDAVTWADVLAPGDSVVNGVSVHRYRSEQIRHKKFDEFSCPVLLRPATASDAEQWRWIEMQGPVCPTALDAAVAGDAALLIFYPYLFWPTVHGVRRVGRRAVMHPAAHDEPPIRLPLFADVFTNVGGLVFHTDSERRFTEQLFPATSATPQLGLGLGVEPRTGDPEGFVDRWGLSDTPFLLCLGRVDNGKGADLLARFFRAYKSRRPGPLKLVFAGQVVNTPIEHPDIVLTGPLDEDAKWGALRSALALVSPSPHESFSIVLMEAWTAGLPVMINARCGPTAEHAQRSLGGLTFNGYGQFEVGLDRLSAEPVLRAALGAAGAEYVAANFAWDHLIDRYVAFLERVAA